MCFYMGYIDTDIAVHNNKIMWLPDNIYLIVK